MNVWGFIGYYVFLLVFVVLILLIHTLTVCIVTRYMAIGTVLFCYSYVLNLNNTQ